MMRFTTIQTLCAVAALATAALFDASADAVPITSGTGPGGIGTTDGSSNLQLWLRAEDLQESSGSVTLWPDASGNGFDASPGTGDLSAPAYTASGLNSLPAARFSGVTTGTQALELNIAAAGMVQNVPGATMFAAFDHSETSVSGNQVYFAASDGGGNGNFRTSLRTLGGAQAMTVRRLDDETPTHLSSGATPVTPIVVTGLVDYVNRDAFRYTNGDLIASNTNILTDPGGNTENTASDAIVMGNTSAILASRQQILGDMGEVIVMNRAVSAAERILVDNYLSSKFNAGNIITGSDRGLASGDRYAGDTTLNGNYDFHVFGAGQAADGSQMLSSGNSGFGVDLTGETLSNDNWVLAGRGTLDDTNSVVNTDLGTSGVDARWERDWYVDVTGSIGATLAFNFADAGLSMVSAGDYALLYRGVPSGDFSLVDVAPQFDGDTILFQLGSVDLIDGFYTLGFTVPEPSTAMLTVFGLIMVNASRRKRTRRGLRL